MRPSRKELRLLHICDQNLQLARAHLEVLRDLAYSGDVWPLVKRLGVENDRIVSELEELLGYEVTVESAIKRAIELAGVATLIAGLIEQSRK